MRPTSTSSSQCVHVRPPSAASLSSHRSLSAHPLRVSPVSIHAQPLQRASSSSSSSFSSTRPSRSRTAVTSASASAQPQRKQEERKRPPKRGEYRFTSVRSVSIPCAEIEIPRHAAAATAAARGVVSVEEYLSEQIPRIVDVVFPDSRRLQRLDADTWRVHMRQITFFGISATPICVLRVFHDGTCLRLFSRSLELDLVGAHRSLMHIPMQLALDGQLWAESAAPAAPTAAALQASPPSPSSAAAPSCHLDGIVDLGLTVHLPVPLSLLPVPAVEPVGNAILDAILSAMQGALVKGLVGDYTEWGRGEAERRGKAGGAAAGAAAAVSGR